MIKIGILGARGRMGQMIQHLISNEFSSVATVGAKVGRNDLLADLLKQDIVIDVSSAMAMCELANLAISSAAAIPPFVVGSTGWNQEQTKVLEKLGEKTAVLVAPNFSMGVFAVSEILKKFAPLFHKLGYTPVMVEAHHRHKKDAPSGTAISLNRAIDPKNPDKVQTHSIRAGEVVGNHEITFYGPGDRISIGHSAQDRSIFARGAIETSLWLAHQNQSKKPILGIIGIDRYFESLKEYIK